MCLSNPLKYSTENLKTNKTQSSKNRKNKNIKNTFIYISHKIKEFKTVFKRFLSTDIAIQILKHLTNKNKFKRNKKKLWNWNWKGKSFRRKAASKKKNRKKEYYCGVYLKKILMVETTQIVGGFMWIQHNFRVENVEVAYL